MPVQITALPTPPSTNDPSNFNTRADAFLGQMPTFATEANALAAEVAANAIQVAADRVQTGLDRDDAAASAASALNAPGTNGTSATSVSIGMGTKVFSTQAGKAWSKGQGLTVASFANPQNQMRGIITSYSGTSLTMEVNAIGGSGSFSDWVIAMSAGTPIAPASQMEAEGGVAQGVYMDPLRTRQAIDKLAILGADPVITATTTLTVSSKFAQFANMPRRGLFVFLPNATTLPSGLRYSITNQGRFDLAIKDSVGVIKAFVRPGKTVLCFLADSSIPAGGWKFSGHALFGETGYYFATNTPASIMGQVTTISLDSNRDLTVFATGTAGGGVKGVIYDKITGLYGNVVTLNAVNAQTGVHALLIGVDKVLITYNVSNNYYGQVLTTSGTSITPSAAATASVANASITPHRLVALGSTYVQVYTDFPSSTAVTRAIGFTVSGTAVTIGSPVTVGNGSGGGGLPSDNGRIGVLTLGASLLVAGMQIGESTIWWNAVTASGASLTAGTQGGVATSSIAGSFRMELLSTGRVLLIYMSSSSPTACLLSVSGTSVGSTAPFTTGSVAWAGALSEFTVCNIGGGKAVACYALNNTNAIQIWTYSDTAGALSASAVTTANTPGFPGTVARLGQVGNDVYFAIGSSQFSTVVRFDISTQAIADLHHQYHGASVVMNIHSAGASDQTPHAIGGASRFRTGAIGLLTMHSAAFYGPTINYSPGIDIQANDSFPWVSRAVGATGYDQVIVQPDYTLRLDSVG